MLVAAIILGGGAGFGGSMLASSLNNNSSSSVNIKQASAKAHQPQAMPLSAEQLPKLLRKQPTA